MYNNLDASQDTTLFSQYSQSQEDSLEKPGDIQIEAGTGKQIKDEAKEQQEQKMEFDTHAGNEGTKCLSEDGHLNDSITKSCPRDISIGENTSAGSNCSTSDMVSDTPPQPASRRQSFITLEKFDPLGNKPFSTATLSTFPVTQPISAFNQVVVKDSAATQDNQAEKCEMRIGNLSDSKAEQTAYETRQKSKLIQIEEPTQGTNKKDSMDIVESGNCKFIENHVQLEEADCIPDTQVAESSLILTEKVKQAEKDNENEADIESKENKPPGSESFDLKHNQATLDSNQKSLRRSSRRRLEISEVGNTDKEKSDQSKDKNVENEKPVQKGSQAKNEDLQSSKPLSEKLEGCQNVAYKKQGNENIFKDFNKQEALPEEIITNDKDSLSNCKSEVSNAQDSASEPAAEEKTAHPRYKTRRSSLVTVACTENSESDSSETREEITKKKRMMRAKPKTVGTSGIKEEQLQSLEQPASPVLAEKETSTNMEPQIESRLETDAEVTVVFHSSVVKGKSKTNYSSVDEPSGLTDKVTRLIEEDTSIDECMTHVTGSTNAEFHNSEPPVQVAQSNTTYDVLSSVEAATKTESLLTEPMLEDFSTMSSDVFAQTDSSFSDLECHHKRSKRLRKSKGCDCCSGQLQEKTVIESKGSEKRILKLEDKVKKAKLAHLYAEEDSCVEEQFEDTVLVGPSAMSTHLLTNKKLQFFKASATELKSTLDSEEENTVNQNATNVDTDQAAATLKTNINLNSLLPEKQGLNNNVCESCPAAELGSNMLPNQSSTPLLRELDKIASIVQTEKLETQGSVKGVVEVNEEHSSCMNEQELINECDQNKKITSPTASEARFSTSHEMKGATEIESDSAVFESVTIADEAIEDIDNPDDNPEEQATACTVTFGEPVANGEQAAMDIETSGEHKVVPNAVQQAFMNIATSGEPVLASKESGIDITSPGELTSLAMNNVSSPPKFKGFECADLVPFNGSPSEVQSRIWSPSASPSTSILKKGLKRPQEEDSPSPVNKIRRVSFADPIYKEELADDIDRRSPVVRCGSSSIPSSSSPTTKNLKMSPNVQCKLNTTPTKGFISPGSRIGAKSSKKCLITEMTRESLPSSGECVYPALVNCATPVDVILPQITSNMWARGLGQLIRAKNIKTIGDLSALTVSEIKTLPIRSPKISNVKKALRMIHEQQMKSRGFEEILPLEEVDKQVNGLDEKASPAAEEERLAPEPPSTLVHTNPSTDIMAKINALAIQLTPEELCHYSARNLFEMHDKLTDMSGCLMRSLQARWTSPPHQDST